MNKKTTIKTVKVLLELAYYKMKCAVYLCGSISNKKRRAFDQACYEADCFMVEALCYMRKDNDIKTEDKLYTKLKKLIALRVNILEDWQAL